MTTVAIPAPPRSAKCNPQPIEAGGPLLPVFGAGARQDMQRLGDRWSIQVDGLTGQRSFAASVYGARMAAKVSGATLTMPWPQPPFCLPIGTPLVSGADQAGASLDIDGATPRLFLPAMSFFNVVGPTQDGLSTRKYLHMTTTDSLFDASGAATLAIWPMMRAVFDDDAALDFVEPVIEGFIHTPADFGIQFRRIFDFPSFVLAENE